MRNIFLKGLFMSLISFVSTSIANNGFPSTATDWLVLLITVVGTVLIYFGQSFMLPTTSKKYGFDWRDLVKTFILGAGNLFVTSGAAYVIKGHILWEPVLKGLGTIIFIYVGKQFASNSNGELTKTQ